MPVRVLIAFDKFKDALSAAQACETAGRALKERHPEWMVDLCPLADGGDGFSKILTRAAHGEMRQARVTGPRGEPVDAAYGLVSAAKISRSVQIRLGGTPPTGRVAVVELATASGLALLPPALRDPWQTSTLGTGELLLEAARAGADAILLGVGGSATNDLGTGALAALGLQFLSASGEPVHPPVPARWNEITRLRGEFARELPPVFIACDVTNPLLGPRGAATVFGPQKGLRAQDIARLENESARLALMLCAHCGQPDSLMDARGAGAAGGTPFGLTTAARATIVRGADLMASWLDLDLRLAAADLVLTGEGCFDDSSLEGKGPGTVVSRALALGIETHVFAGEVLSPQKRRGLGLHAITPPGTPLDTALDEAAPNLAAAVRGAF